MNKNKFTSSVKWVLGTIILGALGSGLWDLFLSDLLNWVGISSLELASNLISGFRDGLYDTVSSGAVVSLLRLPAVLTAILFVMIPVFLFIRIIIRTITSDTDAPREAGSSELSEEKKSLGNRIRLSLVSILVVVYFFEAFQFLYTASAASVIEKSIDILAPHISEEARLVLHANYRSIENAEDYYKLFSELKELEIKYKVKLPEFDPL